MSHRTSIIKRCLAGLACLASSAASEAASVHGDFEAKVVLQQEGAPAGLPLSITVVVSSPTSASPKFSGKVVSGSLSQSIAGSFVADEESSQLTATVANLKGVPSFTLSYVQPFVDSESGESSPDSLTLSFGETSIPARPAVTLDLDDNGKSWTLTDAFAGALRVNPDSLASLGERIEAIDEQVRGLDQSLLAMKEEVAPLADSVEAASAAVLKANNDAKTVKSKAAQLVTARNALTAAETAIDSALSKSSSAFTTLVNNLKSPDLDPDSAAGIAEELATQVFFLLSDGFMNEDSTVASQLSAAIRNATSATTLELFWEKAAELPFELPVDLSFLDTDAKQLAAAKSFWTGVSAQVTALNATALNLDKAEKTVALVEDTLASTRLDPRDEESPYILDALNNVDIIIQEAMEAEAQAKEALASKNLELASLTSQKDSLISSKAVLTAAKALGGFKGYGTLQGAVKATSSAPSKPTAILATIAGVSPDGQKFTSSSKLRSGADDAGGVFYINTVAGKNPLIVDVGYNINTSEKNASAATLEDGPAVWAGLDMIQNIGGALFPSKVLDLERADKNRLINLFSGPIGEDGLVSASATATTPVVVSFGEAEEAAPIDGFGALLTNANKTSKLLVAKKGSTFTVTPSATAAPTFAGAYPFGGSAAKTFTGVFIRVEGESGPTAKGFGSLVVGPTASVPVEVNPSTGGDEAPVPETPSAPPQPLVVWTAFSTGSVSFNLNDMPSILSLTTVSLFKGTKLIATAEALADGTVFFPSKGLVAGSDYTLKVSREFVTGIQTSEPSEPFEISARALPVYTYQTLLGPGSSGDEGGTSARNGIPHQGRLTVTTTATGAWTGRLEWVSLTEATDPTGQPAQAGDGPAFIPAVVSYTLKGQLAPSTNPETPSALVSSLVVPVKGSSGHQLDFSISDGSEESLAEVFGAAPTSLAALSLQASLTPDSTFGEESSVFSGTALPASKGVAAAKGKYSTVSLQEGSALNNHSHTIDYAGSATATYTFATSSTTKITGSSNIRLDGSIPFLAVGSMGKYSQPYFNSTTNKKVSASMSIVAVVACQPRLVGAVDENNPKITRFSLEPAPFYAAGTELEVAAKSKGGHLFREDWASGENVSPRNGLGGWAFSGQMELARTKRYADFLAEEKLTSGIPYTFEVHLKGSEPSTYTVTFDSKGAATFDDFAGLSVASRPISLSATYTTGAVKAVIKVKPNQDGIMEISSATGNKAVTSTGFALPDNGSLSGWGGIEGGDVGWRLKRQ
jgi:hypothetical protein